MRPTSTGTADERATDDAGRLVSGCDKGDAIALDDSGAELGATDAD